jgi:SpoVK/Ycf46/Vps4 family AAA+-type ATPase
VTSGSAFELVLPLPDARIDAQSRTLVGFEARYERLRKDLTLLLDPDALAAWSKRRHRKMLPICDVLAQRYPLVIFHGDVGTGKTATAEGVASRLARELRREATLYKLSTRVRGTGLHGEMSKLIGDAFDEVVASIGKKRLAFLLIDEADAIASSRETLHSHQEEKAGTNTLIQKIDDVRKHGGRFVVFLSTNRLKAVDPAVTRRAAQVVPFQRPDERERRELLAADLSGIDLTEGELDRLVEATGASPGAGRAYGFTFSDLRTRLLPAAVLEAFPDAPLTFEALMNAARSTHATPPFDSEAAA